MILDHNVDITVALLDYLFSLSEQTTLLHIKGIVLVFNPTAHSLRKVCAFIISYNGVLTFILVCYHK